MTEPMAAPPEYSEGESTSPWQERRSLIAVAALAGVAVVGLGAWFLLFSGGGAEEDGLVPSARKPGVTAPAEPTKAPVTTLPIAQVDSERDPFDPIYAAVAPSLPAAATPPPASGGVTDPTVPGVPPVTTPGGGSSSSSTKLTLLAVDTDSFRAQIRFAGGSPQWVKEGGSFGPRNSITLGGVYAEEGGYATFFVGDDEAGTSTDLYVGDTKKF